MHLLARAEHAALDSVRRAGQTEPSSFFREAIRFQPNLAAAHANLGELLVQSGRRDEGLAHLQLTVKLDPSNALARRALEQAGSTEY